MPRGMQRYLTSGARHERTGPLYVWGLPRRNRKRRHGLDLCGRQPPAASAQACPPMGGPLRDHETPLAAGGQKHRWPTWFALGCLTVCALGGVDAGEEPQRARHGGVSGRKCRGAGVHRTSGRPRTTDSGPCQPCPSLCGSGQGRRGRGQCCDVACRQRLGVCRYPSPLVRYHSAGVAHRLSQRTGHLAGCGAALWSRLGEAQNPRGVGGRYGTRAGADDPQDGQRTPPLCQGARGKAAGVDTAVDRGGPVGRADTPAGPGAWRAPRPCDTQRHHHADNDARRSQAAHPADRAVDHHRGGSQGQNRACWCDAGAGDRAQQGGEEGRIWPAVSPESSRRGVCLWDLDPWERVDESKMPLQALAGYRAIFGAQATPALVVYDRGGYATATVRALAHEGVKEIGIQPKGPGPWHVAEAVRETVRSERGKTEGIIGTLKTDKYGFNKPKERLWQTLEMAGPRSVLSFNLNKLMRDVVRANR